MTEEPEQDEPGIEWPEPRDDLDEEPAEPWAKDDDKE